jgi:ribonuclease BN (tRNA processing enzyme)
MRVTVLGKSPAWQDAAGACSGYLVQEQGFTLLLDCGNGVFSRLREYIDYADVDAVLVSHLHADHFFDVVPYSFALSYGVRGDAPSPPLHGPPGALDCFRRVGGCLGDESLITGAFAVNEYAAGANTLTLGPLTVTLCEVPHYVLTHAVAITAPGSGRFTFGADCRPNDGLVRFASGSDLMIAEATLLAPETFGYRGHLTAHEAGAHGRAAHARRLVLTHFSDELDAGRVAEQGAAGFGAAVELASAGAVYEV